MPELPEVQTTVRGLQNKVLGKAFIDAWSDWYEFPKEELKDKKILKVWRRAKNIIFGLSEGYSLLVHQKMTGHLLYGNWDKRDKANSYIHLKLFLDNGEVLALSDLRKFAKVELWKTNELLNSKEFKELGPEPLEESFTFEKFKSCLAARRGKIKQVLMDPYIIAGIGNIYSSEALWHAKIHPEKNVAGLSSKDLKNLYIAIKKVLELGVKLGGESFSDYRKPDGSKGDFDAERKVYKREGQKCARCGTKIKRLKVGQRSAFYCPKCQTLDG